MARSATVLIAICAAVVVVVLGLIVMDLLFDRTTQAVLLMTWGTLTGTGSLAGQ